LTDKRPESVLVVVHTRNEVLLLERADWPGFWQSVTGSLAPAEGPRDAAVRELGEETGLVATGLIDCDVRHRFPIPPERRSRYGPGVTTNLEHAFRLPLVRRPRVCPNPAEHCAYRWASVTEAAHAASSWTNRATIRSLPLEPRAATVVLVHGLWMGPAQMSLLAARLRRAGFATRTFGYSATRQTPAEAAAGLAAVIDGLDTPAVHLVGHSLGGLVIADLLAERVPHGLMRTVLLGSPMRGARAAHGLEKRHLAWSLGRSREGLLEGAPGWPRDVPVAVIAGRIACGQGRLVARLPRPNDGVVALRDTALAGAQRLTVATNHLGLLTAPSVAWATAGFLATGRLPPCRGTTPMLDSDRHDRTDRGDDP